MYDGNCPCFEAAAQRKTIPVLEIGFGVLIVKWAWLFPIVRLRPSATRGVDAAMKKLILFSLCVVVLIGCRTVPHEQTVTTRDAVRYDAGLPVVYLSGTPYEIGYQHGAILRDKVREHYANVFAYLDTMPRVRVLPRWQVNWELDEIWDDLVPYMPADYLEEMRGLSDASGVSLMAIHRAHAIPDAFPTQCSNGAFWGNATMGGQFLQFRNLDWSRKLGVHNYACVFVVSPKGKHSFVNLGFIGFIGTLSGMNDRGIAVGQVGSRSADEWHKGTSFIFLLRRVLEEADNVDAGARIVRDAPRTVGINYLIGSAIEKKALALEATAHHFAEFHDADPAEARSPYAVPLTNAVFRADTAFDPAVRDQQTCSKGDPKTPGLEDPHGNSAYDRRYLGQADMVKANYGRITTNEVFALAKKIAMKSNIQSVVYAYPEFWVAYAKDDLRAADCDYHHFNLQELLSKKKEPHP